MNAPKELRWYQRQALDEVRRLAAGGARRVVLALPCGAGKTYTAATLARATVDKGRRVLWMAHRKELVSQAAHAIEPLVGQRVGIIAAGRPNPAPQSPVQVASVQTLLARGGLPEADLIVADEAHHFAAEQWGTLLEAYPRAFHLLPTATPERGDGKPLDGIADAIVAPVQPRQLVDEGVLVPAEILAPSEALRAGIAQDPLEVWQRWAQGRRTVIFCQSIEHSRQLADRFNAHDIPAAHIDEKTPWAQRELAYKRLAQGSLKVLTNVFVLTEGIDIPELECVVIARSMGNAAMYIQASSRSMRSCERTQKGSALLLDLRGVVNKFGTPEADRTYSLGGDEGVVNERDTGRLDSMRCSACKSLRPSGCKRCVFCGYEPSALAAATPDNLRVDLQVVASVRRDAEAFGAYVEMLRQAYLGPGPKASFCERANAAFRQRFGSAPDARWPMAFLTFLRGGFEHQAPPDGWPKHLRTPSDLTQAA